MSRCVWQCDEAVAADRDVGWRDKRVEGLFDSVWFIVLYIRLVGGELGMMPVLPCFLRKARAGLDSYSQTPPRWSLATSWLQPLGVDMSRRYYTHVILPLLFFHSAQVFHAALLGRV